MIVEDLFWDGSRLSDLVAFPEDLVEDGGLLLESTVTSVRFSSVLSSVGILIDLRAGFLEVNDASGALCDSAVMIVMLPSRVRNVPLGGFGIFDCQISVGSEVQCLFRTWAHDDNFSVTGALVEVYFGRVPGLPDPEPVIGESSLQTIRSGWPEWSSPFLPLFAPIRIESESAHRVWRGLPN